MPLYICNTIKDTLSEQAKSQIAKDVTQIHCDITGAPSTFVHVFFFEDGTEHGLQSKRIFLFGNIRQGRTKQQKAELTERITQSIQRHSGQPVTHILVDTTDIPASWVMEAGEILPEPGQEAAWLAAHH